MQLCVVVLSGGSGTRLWPASRESHPKPFMKLPDGESLIQKTYARAKALGSEVLTVTNRDYYFMSKDEQERVGLSGSFLLEPFGRNTAPAIAMAAKFIAETQSPDTAMLILAADHLIADPVGFGEAVGVATQLAEQNYLVTFGIEPSRPESGFGYIEQGECLGLGYKVARFVEKPDQHSAQSYLSSGKFLWNSGMFCFKAGVFLEELGKTASGVEKAIEACWTEMLPPSNLKIVEIPAELFKDAPDISVDFAVMEKSDKVVVVRGNFGWNDIGSWNAIQDLVSPDGNQNRVIGDAILIDTKNTFVKSGERVVATIGISDMVIVDTVDALLVAHKDKTQEVKNVVAQLKVGKHETSRSHRSVSRPWGTYTVLEEGQGFKIKRIEIKPGASISLQMHQHRSEHWIVVNGAAMVTNGDKKILVQPNESTYIPAGQKHRIQNFGNIACTIVEVQCGPYLGEDDIIRFEDCYGRG